MYQAYTVCNSHMHWQYAMCFCSVVTGDANFAMIRTSLTVGGFTQPTVARSLIELPESIEKGFMQRFGSFLNLFIHPSKTWNLQMKIFWTKLYKSYRYM